MACLLSLYVQIIIFISISILYVTSNRFSEKFVKNLAPLLSIAANFFTAKTFQCVYYSWKEMPQVVALFYFKKYLPLKLLLSFMSTVVLLLLPNGFYNQLILSASSLVVWIATLAINRPTRLERNRISAVNNLNIGYGAALWYYHNYLVRFIEGFETRTKEFEKLHRVKLPPILFILFPNSCNVKHYIDETPFIERSRELKEYQENVSGIFRRVFNITVYKINHPEQSFRVALEYAQPLKTLKAFKEFGKISDHEIMLQRQIFYNQLKTFIDESEYSYLCELIEYDDRQIELHNLLYENKRVQKFNKSL